MQNTDSGWFTTSLICKTSQATFISASREKNNDESGAGRRKQKAISRLDQGLVQLYERNEIVARSYSRPPVQYSHCSKALQREANAGVHFPVLSRELR